MELLVSVASAAESRVALEGGADIIDAKDPSRGALGPVAAAVFADIYRAVANRRPLTAAIGDVTSEPEAEHLAQSFAAAGASLVKMACATDSPALARALVVAAVTGARRAQGGVVVVAYADAIAGAAVTMDSVVEVAASCGAAGVLVDTARKGGPGLLALVGADRLRALASDGHRVGLHVAVAGRLAAAELPVVAACGADIAGVRGAACDGGREGRVTHARVDTLRAAVAGQLVT